jgi:hypothetical protein
VGLLLPVLFSTSRCQLRPSAIKLGSVSLSLDKKISRRIASLIGETAKAQWLFGLKLGLILFDGPKQ